MTYLIYHLAACGLIMYGSYMLWGYRGLGIAAFILGILSIPFRESKSK